MYKRQDKYQNILVANISGLKDVYGATHKKMAEPQLHILEKITEHISTAKKLTDAMMHTTNKAHKQSSITKKAQAYCEDVKPYFFKIREAADAIEQLVADDLWPFTKYRELLFVK